MRNEVIRVLTKHVRVVETKEKEAQKELDEARQQICELEKKQKHISEECQDFQVLSGTAITSAHSWIHLVLLGVVVHVMKHKDKS